MQKQLNEMTKQLQEATSQNLKRDNDALGLRREISQLKAQLATCSAAASAITGSYHNQLNSKMSQLLNTLDTDSSLVLKVIGLTRDRDTLEKKLSHGANSTDVTIDVTALQGELEKKNAELNRMMLQVEGTLQNSSLIFQIISLQNQIWDLEQMKQRGDNSPQLNKNIQAQQAQLDKLLIQLRVQSGMPSIMLQLMSVQTKIAMTQRLIEIHIEESRTKKITYQRQWANLVDLLKKKILLLSREEDNKELTMEILNLQMDVERLRQLMSGSKTVVDTRLRELRSQLEELKKLQQSLQQQLEEEDYGQAQLLMKIITIMKEARQLEVNEQNHVASQANTLQNLLQTKEREYAKAQKEIDELKKKLRLIVLAGSVVNENLIQVENNFEKEIAKLNASGETEAALVLTLVKLQNELKDLQDLIFLTDNQKRLTELQNILVAKKEELDSKTEELERSVANHIPILKIIDLQRNIWNLEDKGSSEPIVKEREALQNRLETFIDQISPGGNTQTILRLLNLQSQIKSLEQQLSDTSTLQPTQVNALRNNLALKNKELQTVIEDLKAGNPTIAQNVIAIANLHKQLRNLQRERQSGPRTPSSVVAGVTEQLQAKERELAECRAEIRAVQNELGNNVASCNAVQTEVGGLREQLRSRLEQHKQDQEQINSLQNQLNDMETHCSVIEEKLKGVQSDLDDKMKELQSKSDSVTTLALQVSTLTMQVGELERQVQGSSSEDIIKDLEKTIKLKNAELANRTEELKARSSQAETFLRIVSLQVEIERLASLAKSDQDYANIAGLQKQLDRLVAGIRDESNENTQLVFQIMSNQDEIVRLRKQEQSQAQAKQKKIQGLENELGDIRSQIKEKTALLRTTDLTISNLSAQIMELHQQIQPLEDQISFLKEANANNTRDLELRLQQSKAQLQDSQTQLEEVDKKNYDLIKEITDLREKLQTVRQHGNQAQNQRIKELEQTIETHRRENKRLINTNKDLRQELEMCSTPASGNCGEVTENLQQCNKDADRLMAQLQDIEVRMRELTEDLEEKTRDYETLQHEHQELQNEMARLENFVQELQQKVKVEDNAILANKIFFDPDTANPRLAISTRNTEVTLSRTAHAVTDNPGRFDVLLAVLGKGGYTSGRNYWEVFVANKECYHLGMVSGSAQRKGQMRVSPATGFWTVIMNRQGQFYAMDGRRVTIPMQTRPQVLGILLDYNKGQISIYDASARVHMYTFTRGEPFSGKIYPFFNFCVENIENPTPIVLLTPGSFNWLE